MLEISVKHGQQSMKLWWTACNTSKFSSGFLFILQVVQTWLTKKKASQVPHTIHKQCVWSTQAVHEQLWSLF